MSRKNEIDHADPFQAFHDLVYLQEIRTFAPLMGMKRGTLYNKADADEESHNQPTLRDVVRATQLTGDMRVLDALNEMFDRAAFDVAPFAVTSDVDLLSLLTRLGIENGDFHKALHDALVDGRFTRDELKKIRAAAFDMVAALMTSVRRVEGLLDE